VTSAAQRTIKWYLAGKRPKKQLAQSLRILAILSVAAAGVFPLLAQALSSDSNSRVQPVWAPILLAFAGMCVGLDRYMGYSTAWVRFIRTEQQITRDLAQFQLEWQQEKSTWKDGKPEKEAVERALKKLLEFRNKISSYVIDETNEWIKEFQGALKSIEATVEPQPPGPQNAPPPKQ
jgi:hypothetical protein